MNIISAFIEFILEYKLILQRTIEQSKSIHPPEKWLHGKKGDVIIIPGFNETWVFQKTLAEFLNEKGYSIHTISTIDHNTHTIAHCVKEIETYVRIKELKDVILLAHSKGGLIVQKFLDTSSLNNRVKKAFTFSVPYKGTIWGYAGFQNLHELSLSSDKTARNSQINKRIINMYSMIDQHIIPNRNLLLDGATNIKLNTYWHTRILESEETRKVIAKYL
jgi:triacylglycerol lipase